MKCLITGSNGYIGNHLTDALLEQGQDINALIFPGTDISNLRGKGIRIFSGDIRDYRTVSKAAEGCESVFHLASYVGQWAKNPDIFHEVNVQGTQNLLDACLANGVRRVLISSSCGIFGHSKNGELVDENTDNFANLKNPYELSKYHQVETAKHYLDHGLEVVFVYPTKVFGPGIKSEGSTMNSIFEGILNGTWHIIPGNGKNHGNYIFVRDVVKGMILALEKGESGEGYILGGDNVTTNELFEKVQKAAGEKFALTHIPFPLMWAAGAIGELASLLTGKKPFVTRHNARRVTADTRVSTQKIHRHLGFKARSLDEALEITFQAIKEKLARERLGKLPIQSASKKEGKAVAA